MAQATQFPGMASQPAPMTGTATQANQQKAVMGFLYSVSKTEYGEFWPVYVGPNTIGRGAANSINLQEESVSADHAQLVIRTMYKNGQKSGIFTFVKDNGSMYGTQVNGETLGFDPKECKSGDVITIGSCYELLFIQVDAEAIGLAPKADFKACCVEVSQVNTGWQAQQPAPTPAAAPQPVRRGTVGMSQPASSPFNGGQTAAPSPAAPQQQGQRESTVYMPNQSVPKF